MKLEWKSCLRLGVTIFLVVICLKHWEDALHFAALVIHALQPLMIGTILAYILNILMSFYERHLFAPPKKQEKPVFAFFRRHKRGLCMMLAIFTLLFIIALIIALVVPELIACVQLLIEKIPPAINDLVVKMQQNQWLKDSQLAAELENTLKNTDWEALFKQAMGYLSDGVGSAVGFLAGTITTTVSGLVTAFLSIIFTLYILAGKDRLLRQCSKLLDKYLKPRFNARARHVGGVLNDCFHRYIVGQCTEALILGALCTLGMFILRMPYATMIGALIAFTALIPVAGAYIGAGVGAFMILTVSPLQALGFLIFLVILQQLEGNLIYPRVVGSSLGLPGMWVLAAVTLGGSLMGILGMLLFVPLTAAVYRLIQEDVSKPRPQMEN